MFKLDVPPAQLFATPTSPDLRYLPLCDDAVRIEPTLPNMSLWFPGWIYAEPLPLVGPNPDWPHVMHQVRDGDPVEAFHTLSRWRRHEWYLINSLRSDTKRELLVIECIERLGAAFLAASERALHEGLIWSPLLDAMMLRCEFLRRHERYHRHVEAVQRWVDSASLTQLAPVLKARAPEVRRAALLEVVVREGAKFFKPARHASARSPYVHDIESVLKECPLGRLASAAELTMRSLKSAARSSRLLHHLHLEALARQLETLTERRYIMPRAALRNLRLLSEMHEGFSCAVGLRAIVCAQLTFPRKDQTGCRVDMLCSSDNNLRADVLASFGA